MSVDLAELPTSELVAELENRSVASLICLMLPNDPNSTETKSWDYGNDFALLGLAESSAYRIKKKIHTKLEPDYGRD